MCSECREARQNGTLYPQPIIDDTEFFWLGLVDRRQRERREFLRTWRTQNLYNDRQPVEIDPESEVGQMIERLNALELPAEIVTAEDVPAENDLERLMKRLKAIDVYPSVRNRSSVRRKKDVR